MSDERRRPTTVAEWVTFGVAAVIVVGVLAAILSQVTSETAPPSPSVEVHAAEARDGRHVVPVTVTNEGDETAQDVQVTATLTTDDGETTADQTIDFLAGGDEEELEFSFEEDPGDGELVVEVGAYRLP